ncbi:SGNH/GDSL hydrolase family protein [Lachnoclostridium phytofermentans]|uniref:SGNH/GDSL hydrolase family protein n=1 Tax=Lachnoclostridium phytofermentans TaxID=66219 RepID=UPI00049735AA|nr:SGNH/GDSL hydrolase family protein [Lachnoclostridium phytofermentans]
MDTYREEWKKQCKKRRRARRKRVVFAISVTGMLSLSIFLFLSQGGSSRFGAKAANSHKAETSIEEEDQRLDDNNSTAKDQESSGQQSNIDSDKDPLNKETNDDMNSNNEGNMDNQNPVDSDTTSGDIEEKEQNSDLEDNTTDTQNPNSNGKEESNNENSITSENENSKENASEEGTSKTENTEAEDEFFKDSIFIGDSRTEGLGQYGGVKNAKFYTHRGLMVNTAIAKDYITLDNKEKGNVLDAARQSSFSKVYLMFGVNELGWQSLDKFIEYYRDIINGLRKIEPDCEIIIQSNYPVTKKMNEGDKIYNNTNVKKFNDVIKKMAEEEELAYIDLYSLFEDENGNLPDDATSDGVHLNPSYFKDWKQCLIDFGSGNTER